MTTKTVLAAILCVITLSLVGAAAQQKLPCEANSVLDVAP